MYINRPLCWLETSIFPYHAEVSYISQKRQVPRSLVCNTLKKLTQEARVRFPLSEQLFLPATYFGGAGWASSFRPCHIHTVKKLPKIKWVVPTRHCQSHRCHQLIHGSVNRTIRVVPVTEGRKANSGDFF